MGRPLYSKSYNAPAVRVETPAEVQPAYARWSERQFDPDADAFFESDDAVYEAFLSPEDTLVPAVITALAMGANAQQASAGEDRGADSAEESDDSAGVRTPGRETPLATSGAGDRVIQEYHRYLRESQLARLGQATPSTPSMSFATFEQDLGRWFGVDEESSTSVSSARLSQSLPQPIPQTSDVTSLATPSENVHIPVMAQRPSTPPAVPRTPSAVTLVSFLAPSTPALPTPHVLASPSPAPISTPRIYTWRPAGSAGGARVIAPPTSPSVRRSLGHMSTPMLRRPDVIV